MLNGSPSIKERGFSFEKNTWQNESGVEPHPEVEEDWRHVDDATEQARRLVVHFVLDDLNLGGKYFL